MKMEYRQHASVGVLRNDTYYKHVQAMTAEKLHDKSEIAEELAIRDMRIKEVEVQLTAMTQERDWLNHKSKCLEMERVSQEERIATMTEERDNWQRQSSDNWNSAVKNGLMLAAEQVYSAQLREALETCKNEMQGDKWDALYIDGVLAGK